MRGPSPSCSTAGPTTFRKPSSSQPRIPARRRRRSSTRPRPAKRSSSAAAQRLELTWEPFRDGIRKAKVPPGFATDQLFVNGEQQILARYPNYDPKAPYFNGTAADAFSKERAARWADPRGGFIHAMHKALWGDFHYLITGKDKDGNVTYEGGWQNNRRMGMHDSIRFVENIFEELDAPGEWFLDAKAGAALLLPAQGSRFDQGGGRGRAPARTSFEFRGTEEKPVRFVTLKGLTFRHAARTFMDNKEPLLRSDWTIYRGGAVLFDGCEDCALEDCTLDQLGGNAVFVNNYNRRVAVRGCHITEAGANGVAFVGDPEGGAQPALRVRPAARPQGHRPDARGRRPNNYPADCLVEDCLIHRTGRVEKQTAPVEIAMSQGITVRHCSIYDVPRAGINIGDGCWGGHVIEFCDVFDTVKETGDHGSFNSWGRDRYWGLDGVDLNRIADDAELRDLPVLDTVKPIILRNNRWRCDHGWDIDLDDGSTNYHIYNNLCLHGGIKLREGFRRVCENNIMVGNSLHPHVWFRDSEDVFRRNIVFAPYRPISVPAAVGPGMRLQPAAPRRAKGSETGAALAKAERARRTFPRSRRAVPRPQARRLPRGGRLAGAETGFRNFPMDQFGVRKPELKKIARTPPLPDGGDAPKSRRLETRRPGDAMAGGEGQERRRAGRGVGRRPARRGRRAGRRGARGRRRCEGRVAEDGRDPQSGRQGDGYGRRPSPTVRRSPAGATVNLTVFRDQRETVLAVEGGLSR